MKYVYGSICCQEIATFSLWTNRAFYEVLKNTDKFVHFKEKEYFCGIKLKETTFKSYHEENQEINDVYVAFCVGCLPCVVGLF